MNRNASASCLLATPFCPETITTAARSCLEKLQADPDLVFAFVSSDYRGNLAELIEILQIDGHASTIVGSSGSGLIGVETELEQTSGVSLLFLSLPKTLIKVSNRIRKVRENIAARICLSNPIQRGFERSAFEATLPLLNSTSGGKHDIGGVVSGGPEQSDLFLFTENGISREPSLFISLGNGIQSRAIVSQSCRPIGDPLIVTSARDDEILTLARRQAFEVLEETYEALEEHDRRHADGNVFAGLATLECVETLQSGDFVVRPIVGADLKDGRLKITTPARVGQTLQFQLRDPKIAEENLKRSLVDLKKEKGEPMAGLVFSGRSRGVQLFGEESRDTSSIAQHLGVFPMGGVFTNGELGPVGEVTFQHEHSLCGVFFYDG